jgi:thiol-disulfide isomerase/thioredoxin
MSKMLKILGIAGVILSITTVLLIRQRSGDGQSVGGLSTPAVAARYRASGLPRLVDLGSTNCTACKKMALVLEELTRDHAGRLDVEFIDVGLRENQPLAREYGVRLIPTLVFLDAEGAELWRHEGPLDRAEILAKWNELGFDFE